ncbi:hypothetical protein M0811_13493 [Anaeramoeba ignava]|uniref:Uncharacterized protein n=1 Tax=Anaeramoeba ignava TaxID=1746090 RepID=A0A9Q0L5V0_ANAIG|nr:hypothetical protein M0811_13493 [Anaeramoeba ignava]
MKKKLLLILTIILIQLNSDLKIKTETIEEYELPKLTGFSTSQYDYHHLYLSTDSTPGIILKICVEEEFHLSDFIELDVGNIWTSVMDPVLGYIYYGTANPAIFIRRRSTQLITLLTLFPIHPLFRLSKFSCHSFVKSNNVTLPSGIDYAYGCEIDKINGFFYVVTDTSPGIIARISLKTFLYVDSLTLQSGQDLPEIIVAGKNGDFIYVGTFTEPMIILRIDAKNFSIIDSITGDNKEFSTWKALLDPTNTFIYFLGHYPASIVKINVQSFTKDSSFIFEDHLHSDTFAIDFVTNLAYVASYETTELFRINISSMTQFDKLDFPEFNGINSFAIDQDQNIAFLAIESSNATIGKFDLQKFSLVEYVSASISNTSLLDLFLDTQNGFLYCPSKNAVNSSLFQVNASHLSIVQEVQLVPNMQITTASFDAKNLLLYVSVCDFVTLSSQILKITVPDLIIQSTLFFSNTRFIDSLIDSEGFLYIASQISNSYFLLKIQLSNFQQVDQIDLGSEYPESFAIDTLNHMIYYSYSANPIQLAQISLQDFSIKQPNISISFENPISTIFIDSYRKFGYFCSSFKNQQNETNIAIFNVSLDSFVDYQLIQLSSPNSNPISSIIDPSGEFAYIGTQETTCEIVKMKIIPEVSSNHSLVFSILLLSFLEFLMIFF